MKKNINYLILLMAGGMMFFSGCKKGDSFYISPNNPAEVTASLFLTAIEVSTFNTYEGDLIRRSSIYTQQNVGVDNQSAETNNYNITDGDFDNSWTQCYQTLFTCKQLNDQFGAKDPYYSGIADILAVMNWGILTDMWGDIPFSDALKGKGNMYQAKYDKQEDVYKGMMALLDGAIVKLNMPASANVDLPDKDDLTFNGDTKKWIAAAYSLKARYLNRLSNRANNDAAILDALSNGIKTSSDDLLSIHGTASTEANQWNAFQNSRPGYILAGLPFVDSLMLRLTDKRIYSYFDTTNINMVVGSPVDNANTNASTWGDYLAGKITSTKIDGDGSRIITRDPSQSIRLISFTELKFIEAEVLVRQGNATGASSALNAAIMESCKMVTAGAYDGNDIATYTTSNTTISRIIYEKWLALFGTAEPYNDYRRTGYPALIPNPVGLINVIPKRNLTPNSERVGNPNNAPIVSLTDPVWFAQ